MFNTLYFEFLCCEFVYTNIHIHIYIHTYIHTCIHTYIHTTHIHTYIHTHIQTNTNVKHTQTHTHTHTNKHTYTYESFIFLANYIGVHSFITLYRLDFGAYDICVSVLLFFVLEEKDKVKTLNAGVNGLSWIPHIY